MYSRDSYGSWGRETSEEHPGSPFPKKGLKKDNKKGINALIRVRRVLCLSLLARDRSRLESGKLMGWSKIPKPNPRFKPGFVESGPAADLALLLLVFGVVLHRKNLEEQNSEGWEPVQARFFRINIFLHISVSDCPSGFILE